jgi:uncharacterized lipoprotein NlpE involved in copper resistance
MKKKIIYAFFLILIVLGAPSCQKDCKTCKKVFYLGTTLDHEESASQYCGTELITIEATAPVTINGLTVKWECN